CASILANLSVPNRDIAGSPWPIEQVGVVRIVTLIIDGGGGNELRFQSILEVLQALRPDIVVLHECLGWEDGLRLENTATLLGLPHTFLGHGRPRSSWLQYHVAILSRWALESPTFYADLKVQAHCLVHVQVQGIPL